MNERYIQNYPDVLTPDEVRQILGIGKNAVYDLLKSGQLKSLKIGKLYRIPKNYLLGFLGVSCYNEVAQIPGLEVEHEERSVDVNVQHRASRSAV